MARILMVDDEEAERVLGRSILESAGHEVLFAGDGEAALKVCRSTSLDLVLSDLAMPGINGLRFIRDLREEGIHVPVIAISGWAADQLDLAEDYGADFTLAKPVGSDALLAAVDEVLNLESGRPHIDPWRRGR